MTAAVAVPVRHRRSRDVAVPKAVVAAAPGVARTEAGSLEKLGGSWWAALDAAEAALRAASGTLAEEELRERGARLARERELTISLLASLARAERVPAEFAQFGVSRANLKALLGLRPSITACVFNVDGVLIGSAAVHAAAWAETFDQLLAAHVERTHGRFAPFNALAPFDPAIDYPKHIHGKTRLEGVRAFLASRGISLPEGRPEDAPGTETVHGLANRKQKALLRRLDRDGIAAFGDAKRYLVATRDAGIRCAAISASANMDTMLERAGIGDLIDGRVDGHTIVSEHLRPRPAPDIPLAACRLLGIPPARSAAFEPSAAGVAAARAAGYGLVIGVDSTGGSDALRARGADRVVGGLADLLEQEPAA